MRAARKSPLPVLHGERVRVRGGNESDASHLLFSTQTPIGSSASKIDQSKLLPLTHLRLAPTRRALSPLRSATGRGDVAPPFPHGARP
jgi:hypothetical protein